MITNGSVNVRDRVKFSQESISNLEKKSVYVMNCHTGIMQCDYTAIFKFDVKPYEGLGYKLVVENVLEKKMEITGTSDLLVYSLKKGFISIKDISPIDVLVDDEGRLCKLVKKEQVMINDMVYKLDTEFNGNFYFNGILVKTV